MEPLPPTDSPGDARPPGWFGFAFSGILFGLSFSVNVCQRENQRDEMRKQADEIREIKAMLSERQSSR